MSGIGHSPPHRSRRLYRPTYSGSRTMATLRRGPLREKHTALHVHRPELVLYFYPAVLSTSVWADRRDWPVTAPTHGYRDHQSTGPVHSSGCGPADTIPSLRLPQIPQPQSGAADDRQGHWATDGCCLQGSNATRRLLAAGE